MIRLLLFFLILPFSVVAAQTPPVLYSLPEGVPRAADFRVWINDRELALYETVPAAVGVFDFAGEVQVRIETIRDVKWVDIRPKSLGIEPQYGGRSISFTVRKPSQLSVELNGESKRVLSLFANAPETAPPAGANVRHFKAGAVHEAGTLVLKDGEQVYIEGGAVVRGRIEARNAKKVRVSGRGILDGTQLEKGMNMILLDYVEDAALEGIVLVGSKTWTVKTFFCRRLSIDNLKTVNWDFGSDGVDLVTTSDVTIRDSFIRANDDCIVVKAWGGENKYPGPDAPPAPDVSNIRVSGCVFWNMPWGNALEIGFELRAKTIRDVVFEDSDIIHVERGAAFSIHNGDYATVRDVRFDNIRVEDCRHKLIDLAVFLSQYSADRPTDAEDRKKRYIQGAWDGVLWVYPGEEAAYAKGRGKIQDVTFRNIAIVDGPLPFSIVSGFDAAHPVENVTIENLTFHGRRVKSEKAARLFVERASNVRIR
mgnify:CR=1 FL=1